MSELFIGLMSGTSLDGVDAVLCRFQGESATFEALAHDHAAFPDALRQELLALNSSGPDEARRCALAANAVARSYAALVERLLSASGQRAESIRALGAHGQTIRHRPGDFDGTGFSLQLLNGALLAELSGIAVVCDLRSRDVAAGGQGAPLVPAFHRALFAEDGRDVAVLNIGGISNISLLAHNGATLGFDCGPGNCLMDHWMQVHQGQAYDAEGRWAASGRTIPALLDAMLAEPFFAQRPPRSTGRDLFNPSWLQAQLSSSGTLNAAPADIQASLLELSAQAIARSFAIASAPLPAKLYVCGGGALNTQLMRRLQTLLAPTEVLSSSAGGLDPMLVEASAFAWLAMRHCRGQAGNLPAVTGARGLRILGAYHPA